MKKYEAFVYKWISKTTGEWYIGYHKGHVDDGYISSGKYFLERYNENPNDFERIILSTGSCEEMYAYETKLLCELNAMEEPLSFNKHNNSFPFISPELISESRKQFFKDNPEALTRMSELRKKYFIDNPEFSLKWTGDKNPSKKIENRIKISEGIKKAFANTEIRAKMSYAAKIRANRPENIAKMIGNNNPAKKPENRAKMSISQKEYYKNNSNACIKNSESKKKFYKDNPEELVRMSERMKRYNQNNRIDCETCGKKSIDKSNYKRWHGKNCRVGKMNTLENFFNGDMNERS
jgi:hypothetical protein